MNVHELVVRNLNYLCRTYDGANKLITSTKNRLHAINKDAAPEHQDEVKLMENLKGKISRKITKELEFFPVWTEWAKDVPGVGPAIMGHLILLYYFRFTPVCADCGGLLEKQSSGNGDRNVFVCVDCGKKAKGEGVLTHRIDKKNFPNISSWWHYLGVHVVDGKKPKKQKGAICDWSSKGRAIAYLLGESFIKQNSGHLYRAFFDGERHKIYNKNPKLSKGHNLNRARNHTAKLFLAHFWEVARTLDGRPVTEPYSGTIMGHTGMIRPFYWEPR
jgi:hypothetical protein